MLQYDMTVLFGFSESSSHTRLFPLSNIYRLSGMELGKDRNMQSIRVTIGHLRIQQII
jgi:hypothetical protein